MATNKVVARQANSKIEESRRKIIIDQVFQEAYPKLIKNPAYRGKTLDEMKDMMMRDKKGKYVNKVERRLEGIAPVLFNPNEVFEAPDENSVIIHNRERASKKSVGYSKVKEQKEALSHSRLDFFERIANGADPINQPKTQTGTQLMESTIEEGHFTNQRLIKHISKEKSLNYQRINSSSRQQLHDMDSAYKFFKETGNVFAFDTETFGGKNYDNISELLTVHDISYIHGNVDNGLQEVSFVRGLTQDEADKVLKELKEMSTKEDPSSLFNVYRKAAITYSGNINEMTINENGLIRMVNPTHYDPNVVYTMEDYEKGINNLVKINQQYQRGSNGLTAYEEKVAEMVKIMNDKNHAVLTYNGTYADIPWMNTFIYNTYNKLEPGAQKEFLAQAGLEKMQNLNIEHNLDLMNVLREGSNSDLLKAIYSTTDASKRRMKDGHTALSQEAVVNALLGDAGNAHTSLDDTRNLLQLVLGKYDLGDREQGLLDYAMGLVQEKHGEENMKNFMEIVPGQGDLFMATKGIGYDGTKGVMSFTYDPVADAYRTSSKFDIGKTGKDGKDIVTKRNYGLNAVRKNQFFMVDDVYKLTTNSENWHEVASQFSELNSQELFVAKIIPHYAKGVKGVNIGMEQPSYIVAQTKELLEQTISAKSARVGTYINDEYSLAEGMENLIKVVKTDPTGKIINEKTDLALAVAVQTENVISDTTRRSVSTMSHSRYEKFKEFDALATKVLGEEYQPNKAQKLFNKLALSNDSEVAFQVSKGNVVTVDTSALQEILSVKNMQTRNEVDNLKHAFAYFKDVQPIADIVHKRTTELYGGGSARDIAFETTMNNILASAAEELAENRANVDVRGAYLNSLTDSYHMASDFSGFTFELPNLFKDEPGWLENPLSVSDRGSSITFNLDDGEYGIRSKIKERLIPETTSRGFAKEQEELIAMTSFLKSANASKEYAGMFDAVLDDSQAMQDPHILATKTLEAMKEKRSKSPTVGVRSDILVQNIDKGHQGIKYVKEAYADNLEGFVEKHIKELPRIDVLDKNNGVSRDIVDDLIDNYLVDLRIGGKKFNSAEEYIKKLGHSGVEAKYFVQNVEQTKQAYRSFVTELVKDYSQGGSVDFVYDFEKHRLVAKAAGVDPLNITDSLPRIVGRGINVHTEQGNMKMAFRGILNMEGFVKGDIVDPNAVKIQSNIAYALEHTLEDMKWQLKKQKDGVRSLDNVSYTTSNIGKYLFQGKKAARARTSHITPTTGYSVKESLSMFTLDMKDAYSYIKEIAGMDIMQDKEFINSNILDIIGKYDEFKVGKMTAAQAQYMLKNVNHMLQLALQDNKGVAEVINALNPAAVKHTALNKGVQGVGQSYLRALFGNNQSRPVPHTALIRKSKSQMEDAIKYLEDEGFSARMGNAIELETNHQRGKVVVHGVGEVADSVTLSKANLSEFGYKAALNEYLEKHGDNIPEAVVNKLKAVNLTEQEKVIDGRVADALFSQQQIQKIKDPTNAAEFSEYLDNFKDAMYNIEKDKDGKWQFKYGNKGKIVKEGELIGYNEGYNGIEAMIAKYEGRIKYGVFSEGILVPEDQISEIIKNAKDEKEAIKIINQTFDNSERFYLDRTGDVGFIKLINGGVEKDMSNKLNLSAGSVDETVNEFFDIIGDKSDRYYNINTLKETIDSNYNDYRRQKIEQIKQATGKTKLTKAELKQITSKEGILELALKERYLASEHYQNMMKEVLGASQNVAITAAHEMEKHGSVMMSVEEQIATIQRNIVEKTGVSYEEAAQQVGSKLSEYKVFNHDQIGDKLKVDGNTIVLPQDWNGVNADGSLRAFNIKNFKDMVEKEGYVESLEEGIMTAGEMLKVKIGDEYVNVGTILMSSVSEADDYQGISTSQNFKLVSQKIDGDISKVKQAMNAAKDPKVKKMYKERIDELKEQKRLVISKAAERQRGRSYGKRDIEMLNMQKYDNGFNQAVKRAYVQGGKFQEDAYLRAMGHQLKKVDGEYVKDEFGNYILKDGSKSHSVLSDWTKEVKQALVLGGPGDEIFDSTSPRLEKRLNQLYADENARDTIKKLVENEGAMSKEYAESVYAFMKGHEASRFNTGLVMKTNPITGAREVTDIKKRSIQTVEELQERGFQMMKLEDAIQAGELEARDVVDNPNSIFRKNIILDLGEDAGEGNRRYIAMPFVSNKATVSDEFADSHVIQKNFQKHMNSLNHRKQEIQELRKFAGNSPKDMKTLEKAISLYQDTADEMRKAIHVDVMGKDGILGQLGVHRAEYSMNAKTSSFVYMDDNMFKHIDNDDDGVKKRVLKLTKSHLSDNEANYAALRVATIDGMTLEQHYKEGRYFNTRFAGDELFKGMGLYEESFVADQLGVGVDELRKDVDGYMSQYKQRLKTEGVMVDTVRYPTIKAGSSGPSMLYLDEGIEGLVTKVGIEGQLAYTGDNDGDSVASNLIFRRDANGKIVTSLNAESDDKMFNAASSYMHYRAAGANRYWRKEAESIVYKSIATANSNGDINSMLQGKYILDTSTRVASLDDVNEHRKNVEELLSMYNEANERQISISDIHNDKSVAGLLDEFIEGNEGDYSKYIESFGFERQHGRMLNDMHAKDIVNYTGHVNVPLFKQREIMDLRMVADEAADPGDQALLNRAFGSIEQKIISSKKIEYSDASAESFSAVEDRIEKFTSALNKIYYNRDEGTTEMRRWLHENGDVKKALIENAEELMYEDGHFGNDALAERFLSLQTKLGGELSEEARAEALEQFGQAQEDVATHMIDKVVDNLASLNSDQRDKMKSRYAMGVLTEYGENTNTQQLVDFLGDEGIYSDLLKRMQGAGADVETIENYAFKSGRSKAFSIDPDEIPAFSPESRQTGKKVLESTVEAISHMKPSGLGIGALAVAASVLAVGAVGGNPSQATGMEAAQAAQVGMQDLDMMGPPAQAQTSQTNTGYVINVRGRGNRASINRASQQIARSMSGSFSKDVNINMNISEDSTAINDRFLEQIITDAIL